MARADRIDQFRQSVAAQRARERRQSQRHRNGYQRGRHSEKDRHPALAVRCPRTTGLHTRSLDLFKEFLEEGEHVLTAQAIQRGCPAPPLNLWKEHMRWYANSARGRLDERPTKSSALNHAERLMMAFQEVTGTYISIEDRCEIYNFVKRTMVSDKEVVNMKKKKFLFTVPNFLHLHHSNWTLSEPRFIHGRVLTQMTFLYQIGLFSGARIGAYLPEPSEAFKKGIQYRDVQIVLMPVPGKGVDCWTIDSNITQRHVKNNDDPENSIYSNIMGDDQRLPFAATLLLLAFAFADGALFGYDSPDDLWQQCLPLSPRGRPVPVPLRWEEEFLHKPVCRAVTMDGVHPDKAFDKVNFSRFHIALVRNAGYYETPTYHSIRRQVGKDLDSRYTPAQRSQVLNQDTSVYGRDYIAHTSSASAKDAVLGDPDRSDLLEYFQSFDQFLVPGLPVRLPARKARQILDHPELGDLRREIKDLENDVISKEAVWAVKTLKVNFTTRELQLNRKALVQHQKEWVTSYRKATITSRGKEPRKMAQDQFLASNLAKIVPERARLAQVMPCAAHLSHEDKMMVLKDLIAYMTRDFSVVYLPNEEPVHDMCPVMGCTQNLCKLPKRQRSKHVHSCRRNEFANTHQVKLGSIRYCYLNCYTWFVDGEEWELHCQQHLNDLSLRNCEVMTYCNTMIRPGFCPQCLGNSEISARQRLRQFQRSDELRQHLLDDHANDLVCSPSFCGYEFSDEDDKFYHWCDVHELHENIWKRNPKLNLQGYSDSPYYQNEEDEVCDSEVAPHGKDFSSDTVVQDNQPGILPSTDGLQTDINETMSEARADLFAQPISVYMDRKIPVSPLTESFTLSSSLMSRQPRPESPPIDPQILSEMSVEQLNLGHEQSLNGSIECYPADENTASGIEVAKDQERSTSDASNHFSTPFDHQPISKIAPRSSSRTKGLANSRTKPIKNASRWSVGPMTRARARAESQLAIDPKPSHKSRSASRKVKRSTKAEDHCLNQFINDKLSRERSLASIDSHLSGIQALSAPTRLQLRRSCRVS